MKFYIESYGCTLNHGEARNLMRLLHKNGYERVMDLEVADVLVIFSCTVIRTTELKMLKQLEKINKTGKPIIVSGCMAVVQQPEVERINPDAYFLRPKEINQAHLLMSKISEDYNLPPPSQQIATTNEFEQKYNISSESIDSIVPISTGCLGECTYCITRLARGNLVSYPVDKILREITEAINLGRLELRLTAQDSACYGYDINENLAGLLNKISELKLEDQFRVRVGMMNPDSVKPILPELIKSYSHKRIFKFLHLPVQSGEDEMLKAMGRKYKVSEFFKIISKFRTKFPKLTVSTDIIVGYPSETDEQFQQSLELMKKLRPNIVNITRFSGRPGTTAWKLKNNLTGSVVKGRSRRMTELRFEISKGLNESEIGEEYRVLVTERVKPGTVLCRNDNYLPIVVKQDLKLGSWHSVKVTDATDSYVISEVVK